MDGDDRVIESVAICRCAGCNYPTVGINEHIVRLNAYFTQHRDGQSSLVFAIAITMCKDLCRRMRLIPADSQLDSDVAQIALHKLSDGLHFRKRRRGPG